MRMSWRREKRGRWRMKRLMRKITRNESII
jgi:hypothetical protein